MGAPGVFRWYMPVLRCLRQIIWQKQRLWPQAYISSPFSLSAVQPSPPKKSHRIDRQTQLAHQPAIIVTAPQPRNKSPQPPKVLKKLRTTCREPFWLLYCSLSIKVLALQPPHLLMANLPKKLAFWIFLKNSKMGFYKTIINCFCKP